MAKSKSLLTSHTIEVEVPFFDTDPMGITWHGNYVKYFELVRCALLEKIGYGYRDMAKSGFSWPIVDMRVKYVKSSTFFQKINVQATIVEYENRLKIEYRITDKETAVTITKGFTIQVAVDIESGEMCFCSPSILIEKLQP
ncbi:acyl-CoA thioesterase [Corallincola luteus]|uniref:Acyl-CoA thioesterase n=1 Tax=Corallincola luteus TaxID=1775177 RepID=A0ABY2APA0_9GAMM|nr:acyl-CoA thioesterase [Corallincola luteus]TCI03289.1 acyl-CoA thioesterase [Corallincola luteus]